MLGRNGCPGRFGCADFHKLSNPNVGCRRVSPVGARLGEGLLSNPTAVTRPWMPERVFVPQSGPSLGSAPGGHAGAKRSIDSHGSGLVKSNVCALLQQQSAADDEEYARQSEPQHRVGNPDRELAAEENTRERAKQQKAEYLEVNRR